MRRRRSLTPQNALVATLTPDATGRATHELKEGIYVVRVSHPKYAADVRRVQVRRRDRPSKSEPTCEPDRPRRRDSDRRRRQPSIARSTKVWKRSGELFASNR